MAKYEIITTQFCALSQEELWKEWLERVAPSLALELKAHHAKQPTCSENKNKMKEFLVKLRQMGRISQLHEFLKRNFPSTIREIKEKRDLQRKIISQSKYLQNNPQDSIFSSYSPKRLTFPHRIIIMNGNLQQLKHDTMSFLKDKINGDYIIIDNLSYIEYFQQKYKKEALNTPAGNFQIASYRKMHGLENNSRIISKDKLEKS